MRSLVKETASEARKPMLRPLRRYVRAGPRVSAYASPMPPTLPPRIEDRSGQRTGAVLELIRSASAARPLPVVLGELCRGIAEIAPAPVVSVYLREREEGVEVLVLRANVGLAPGAIDNVRLAMGEGITGFAAECMQPVSSEVAAMDEHFKAIPGIGEEAYAVFLAIPLLVEGRSAGTLVLQRRAGELFTDEDVLLCTALSTAVCLALEASWGRQRDHRTKRNAGTRAVRLLAAPVAPGAVLARLAALPTMSSLAEGVEPSEIEASFERVRADVRAVESAVGSRLAPTTRAQIAAAMLWLDDQRFRAELRRLCTELGPLRGLREVVRSYAQTAHRMGATSASGAWIRARADDLAGLCLVLAARASKQRLCEPGAALLIPDAPNTFLAVHALRCKAAAVLVAGELGVDSAVADLLRCAGVVTVADVAGLSDWARPGDLLSVDADQAAVVVHPSEDEVARVRASSRRERETTE